MSFCGGLYDQWLAQERFAEPVATPKEVKLRATTPEDFKIPVDWDIVQVMNELELLGQELKKRPSKISKSVLPVWFDEPPSLDEKSKWLMSCKATMVKYALVFAMEVGLGKSKQGAENERMQTYIGKLASSEVGLSDEHLRILRLLAFHRLLAFFQTIQNELKAEVAKLSAKVSGRTSFCVGLFDQWLAAWKANPGKPIHPPDFEIPVDWNIAQVMTEIEVLDEELGETPSPNRKLKSCQLSLECYALSYHHAARAEEAEKRSKALKKRQTGEARNVSKPMRRRASSKQPFEISLPSRYTLNHSAEMLSPKQGPQRLKEQLKVEERLAHDTVDKEELSAARVLSLKQESQRLKEQLEASRRLAHDAHAAVRSLSQEVGRAKQELSEAKQELSKAKQEMLSRMTRQQHIAEMQHMRSTLAAAVWHAQKESQARMARYSTSTPQHIITEMEDMWSRVVAAVWKTFDEPLAD